MNNINIKQEIEKVCELLKKGGTICYPTDTIWGIGCDATNSKAVEKLFSIKGRDTTKSMLILVDSIDMAKRYVYNMPDVAVQLFEYAVEPLTIILEGAVEIASNLPAPDGSIGIRIVNHNFCTPLIRKLNRPIVSTSANKSGLLAPTTFSEISPEILNSVDYVVENGRTQKRGKSSKILKLYKNGRVEIIRG